MGTRSLTQYIDERSGIILLALYRQCDGDMQWHGRELAASLCDAKGEDAPVVNGFGLTKELVFNGMGDAAAQSIASLKLAQRSDSEWNPHGIGNLYVYPAAAAEVGQEYQYRVSVRATGDTPRGRAILHLEVWDGMPGDPGVKRIFEGSPAELLRQVPDPRAVAKAESAKGASARKRRTAVK